MDSQLILTGIGDSWGQYIGDILPVGPKAIFDHLGPLLGTTILNLATAGDTSEQTMGMAKRAKLRSNLPGSNFIIMSSGGDDIAGDQFIIWLNDNRDGNIANAINWPRLNAALQLIMADYEDLAELRDEIAPNCVIVCHSYDFPPPQVMGVGVLGKGPWLQPALIECGWIDTQQQSDIVKQPLRAFNNALAEFAANTRNVLHCNTQGTLSHGDWGNELHPTDEGFAKIASTINAAMLPRL